MDVRFAQLVKGLHQSFEALNAMSPVKIGALPQNTPQSGVYLLSEGVDHLYVGRSNRIRQRLGEHSRPSSTHNSAPFAFRLAWEATGKPEGPRAKLERDASFRRAFSATKERVRAMDVRFVGETDQTTQALLEIYVAVVLSTPHNDFDTH